VDQRAALAREHPVFGFSTNELWCEARCVGRRKNSALDLILQKRSACTAKLLSATSQHYQAPISHIAISGLRSIFDHGLRSGIGFEFQGISFVF